MNKKFGSLSSSVNPEQLSATVSGAILAFAGIIIAVAQYFNAPLSHDQIAVFAQQAGTSVGFLWMLYGILRKLVVSLQQRFSR